MILEALEKWLDAGGGTIGQIRVRPCEGGFELCHLDDEATGDLRVYAKPRDARDLSKNDGDGKYRPLKAASNLQRGWVLRLGSSAEVLAALDFFYPAAVGMWARHRQNPENLRIVPPTATLERQTGMYRKARRISAEGWAKIVRDRCRRICLRQILWDAGQESESNADPGRIPLFCPEICNLLVADARIQAREESGQAGKS